MTSWPSRGEESEHTVNLTAAVVTPTIASEHLQRCIASVAAQTFPSLRHYLFIDGKDWTDVVESLVEGKPGVRTVKLEENVGNGWYGHRVYAACSFLVNADVICYLDEDNWFERTHVETLVKTIEAGADWAYSLRTIHGKEGHYICDDNCESLGKWPVFFDDDVFHIDTSSFAVRRDVAINVGHAWYGQWGADRQFFAALRRHYPNFACSSQYTLCYRLSGNPRSPSKEFFQQGNHVNRQKYAGRFPWASGER
jgi:glycosyltransferase involved in cell wall biosynthesis